ncbi:hypothetical protein PHLCEN_2v6956 [Hermanssonia centrifuga]|uniref:Uncharacterized protein n=1 Tax=Hermanssonia centrifuga TaxID=98765 RepID=A0A2R6NY27_9APHY|nr:hypothetical protein PHLCEN_2v6956 [Hermanssonia centrifuga]
MTCSLSSVVGPFSFRHLLPSFHNLPNIPALSAKLLKSLLPYRLEGFLGWLFLSVSMGLDLGFLGEARAAECKAVKRISIQ